MEQFNFIPTAYAGESATYAYDLRGQLVGATYSAQTDEAYDFDANGNREAVTNDGNPSGVTYETGDDNRLTTDGAYAYQYDAEGNRTRRYVDEDESGDTARVIRTSPNTPGTTATG